MNATYWIEADDRQWVLKKESDVNTKAKDGIPSTVIRKESTVGYYPRFGQSLAAMHQAILRENGVILGYDNIGAAIAISNELASRLHNVEPGERVRV